MLLGAGGPAWWAGTKTRTFLAFSEGIMRAQSASSPPPGTSDGPARKSGFASRWHSWCRGQRSDQKQYASTPVTTRPTSPTPAAISAPVHLQNPQRPRHQNG